MSISCRWFRMWSSKKWIKRKTIHNKEGAFMMEIVTHKPISHWCLRTYSNQRRMAAESGFGGIKAGIRCTEHANFSIVIFYILYQPINRIITVACFIYLFSLFIFVERPYILKSSFTHISASHILHHKNEIFFHVLN